jgi:hypothetical protein
MTRRVSFGPVKVTYWQYEIIGCSLFYMLAFIGVSIYISDPTNIYALLLLVPSTILLLIGILSPINVYYKEKRGYYEIDDY